MKKVNLNIPILIFMIFSTSFTFSQNVNVTDQTTNKLIFKITNNKIYSIEKKKNLYSYSNGNINSTTNKNLKYSLTGDGILKDKAGKELYSIKDGNVFNQTTSEVVGTISTETEGNSGIIKSWSISIGNNNLLINGNYSYSNIYLVLLAGNLIH